jgi:hypothetical protein
VLVLVGAACVGLCLAVLTLGVVVRTCGKRMKRMEKVVRVIRITEW